MCLWEYREVIARTECSSIICTESLYVYCGRYLNTCAYKKVLTERYWWRWKRMIGFVQVCTCEEHLHGRKMAMWRYTSGIYLHILNSVSVLVCWLLYVCMLGSCECRYECSSCERECDRVCLLWVIFIHIFQLDRKSSRAWTQHSICPERFSDWVLGRTTKEMYHKL